MQRYTLSIKEGTTGGNDAGMIHTSKEGVATCVVSVPCRYIHSPSSVMDKSDFKNTIELVKEFVKGCDDMKDLLKNLLKHMGHRVMKKNKKSDRRGNT